jgi:phosphinothricin acetyltransferase
VTMRIELARAEDLPRLVAISNWAAEHTTANFATSPESVDDWRASWEATRAMHPWLVARDGDQVVGFAKSGPHRSRCAYQWTAEVTIYLDRAHHGKRLGTALYEQLIPRLRAQGYVTLLAGITAGHAASEALHARFGFTRCATFHRVGWKHGAWHDVGYWELELQPPGPPPGELRPVQP